MTKAQIIVRDKYGNLVDITNQESLKSLNAPPAKNPLLINKEEAVARCGITVKQFDALVKEGIFPTPLPGREKCWRRKQLYEYLAVRKMLTDKVEPGWVYFMEMGDFIKIGWSSWPGTRRNALQTGPYDIIILGAFPGSLQNEAGCHEMFKHLRWRGEWFKKSPGLLAYIAWLKVVWRGDARVIRGEHDNIIAMPVGGKDVE